VNRFIEENITSELFKSRYADVFGGDENWKGVEVTEAETFAWDGGSTYVQNPPYFEGMTLLNSSEVMFSSMKRFTSSEDGQISFR
jgi:aconitase A